MKFTTNWKTSGGGAATIGLGILSLFGIGIGGNAPLDPNAAVGLIVAGGSLLFAKDQNVTGGDTKQQ